MAEGRGWHVVVHDDGLNTMTAVVYMLHAACGLTVAAALDAMSTVRREGSVHLEGWGERAHAEVAVARLQVYGLRAMIVPG